MGLPRTISSRITEVRTNAGLTKSDLADALGRHVRSVYRIESGESSPSLAQLEAIAAACGVSVRDLIPDHSPELQAV